MNLLEIGPLERYLTVHVPVGDSRQKLKTLKTHAENVLNRLAYEFGYDLEAVETIHDPENRRIEARGLIYMYDYFEEEEDLDDDLEGPDLSVVE